MTSTTLRPVVSSHAEGRRSALEQHLAALAVNGPVAIDARLTDISREWSSGRMTKAVTGLIVLASLILTVTASPWFYLLTAVSGVMLAWYAVGRRSWIAALFQYAGYRSGTEIHEEMMALKALRGDFRALPTIDEIEDKDAIARLEGEGGPAYEPEEEKFDARDAAREVMSASRIAAVGAN